jgi:uncharacterized membrane protein
MNYFELLEDCKNFLNNLVLTTDLDKKLRDTLTRRISKKEGKNTVEVVATKTDLSEMYLLKQKF